MDHHTHQCHKKEENNKEFFDRLAAAWDNISVHDLNKVDYITSLLEMKGTERILDVGTGTGIMMPFYEKRLTNGSVLAIDISENMIARCNEKYPACDHPSLEFKVADIYDLDLEKEFNIVMCYSCFPHFKDHQKAVNIFTSSLKSGGKFVIAHSSSRDHINHVHRQGGSDIRDDVLPTLEELTKIMNASGLSVVFERSDSEYHIIIAIKA
jgi:Methylase involved in ubiquinone/menaquinone biosynthesis